MSDNSEAWKGEPEPQPWPSMSEYLFGRPDTPEQRAARAKAQAEILATGEVAWLTSTPLYDRVRACIKCGHPEAKARYWPPNQGGCEGHAATHGHLHRTCKRCHYVWYEKPLDAESGL